MGKDVVEGRDLIEAKARTHSLLLRAPDLPAHVRRESVPHGVRAAGGQVEEDRDLSMGNGQVER